MIFGGGAHHCRSADIDVLDGIFEAAIRIGHRFLEWIKVDNHQVDRLDTVFLHHSFVEAAAPENAAVHFRMQGFDPTGHHFRKAGVVGYFGNRDTFFGDQSSGATGRQKFNAFVCRACASSTMPVLSETLISARRMAWGIASPCRD